MPRTLLIVFTFALSACGSDGNGSDAAVDLGRDMSIPTAGELAPAQTLTHCLAVDATSVYWADQGGGNQVLKVSKSGGTPTAIAMGGGMRTCVVIDAANAYFTDDGDTDGSYVYFITDQFGPADMMSSGHDALVRVPVGGGPMDVLYMDLTSPEAEQLFVDGANVYYSDGTAVTARAKAGGGAPLTFGMGSLHGTPFTTDGSRLVMVESTGIGQGSLVLYRVDGTGRTVLSTTTATPLAVDDSGAYANQAGHLVRLSLDGKSTTQLTATGPRALALDADSLYFTDGAAILKLAR